MRDPGFHEQALGIQAPWRVTDVRLDRAAKTVETVVEFIGTTQCPECRVNAPRHDHRERRFRHLDLYEYHAFVLVRVPRVTCSEHGVRQLPVSFADGRSRFTAQCERFTISLLQEMSISAAAKTLGLSWSEVDTIMRRAVERGLSRRGPRKLRRIGIDEKSVKKRHVYFTIVTDLDRNEVVWIGRGRSMETLKPFWDGLSAEERADIEGVAIDMHEPFFRSTLQHVPDAEKKIVFDRFHVMMILSRAIDATRRDMIREGGREKSGLKRTRYLWLHAKGSLDEQQLAQIRLLREKYVRLGIAWAQKENVRELWRATTVEAAKAFFADWFRGVKATFNEPMIAAGRTLERYLENIVSYLRVPITNAAAEGMNSRIQMVKFRARGYRNQTRFERAIMFSLGGLDMNPAT